MPWFKVDDKLHSHRKTRKAGPAAMGLWVLAGSWSADQLSNGFVPDYIAAAMDRDYRRHAGALVAAGLWEEDGENGDKGWRFHDWDEMQPTRADVEEKRESARERMRRVRAQGGKRSEDVRANSEGTSREVRSTPTRPDPTRPLVPSELETTTSSKALAHRPDEHVEEFAGFWTAYPRKVGKAPALKAYKAARKKTDLDTIAAALRVFTAAMSNRPVDRIPYPATWLNSEPWHDDPQAIQPAPRTNGRQQDTDDFFDRAMARAQQADAQDERLALG